jgi:hypothetical protein
VNFNCVSSCTKQKGKILLLPEKTSLKPKIKVSRQTENALSLLHLSARGRILLTFEPSYVDQSVSRIFMQKEDVLLS